jgi:hypothetical protein
MATILQSLRPVGPSRSQPPAAQHEQTDREEQRSPTLQQQLQTRQPTQGNTQAERAADIERRILLDKELAQRAAQLPAINTGNRSAPPGFGRPTMQEINSGHATPTYRARAPHTPSFQNFQGPAIRHGWEGFVRTYEQELRAQFLKSITKGPRMDFPCFDGTNPGGWIRQCNKYFQMAGVLEDYKVSLSHVYIIGRADVWLRCSKLLKKRVGWPEFCSKILNRFSPSGSYDLTERFNTFRQNNLTVAEYTDQFEDLMADVQDDNSTLSEAWFVKCYVNGL